MRVIGLLVLLVAACAPAQERRTAPPQESEHWEARYEEAERENERLASQWGDMYDEKERLKAQLSATKSENRSLTKRIATLEAMISEASKGLKLCDEIVESLPKPQPPPESWWCGYSERFEIAACHQTKPACENHSDGPIQCTPQPRASCFTMTDRMKDGTRLHCFPTTEFCKKARGVFSRARNPDISSLSKCSVWNTKREEAPH